MWCDVWYVELPGSFFLYNDPELAVRSRQCTTHCTSCGAHSAYLPPTSNKTNVANDYSSVREIMRLLLWMPSNTFVHKNSVQRGRNTAHRSSQTTRTSKHTLCRYFALSLLCARICSWHAHRNHLLLYADASHGKSCRHVLFVLRT